MTKVLSGDRWELVAALGAAWWIEKLITIEWSYPYCSVQEDGPVGAVRGFPLPYEQASTVTSATAFFVPWLYVFNLVAIACFIFLVLRLLGYRLGEWHPRLRKIIVGTAGSLLLVTAVALEMMILSMDVWRPTSNLFSGDYPGDPRYSELRPVALRFLEHPRDCTPSPFWFPNRGARSVGKSKP